MIGPVPLNKATLIIEHGDSSWANVMLLLADATERITRLEERQEDECVGSRNTPELLPETKYAGRRLRQLQVTGCKSMTPVAMDNPSLTEKRMVIVARSVQDQVSGSASLL